MTRRLNLAAIRMDAAPADDLVVSTVEFDDKTPQPNSPQPDFGLLSSSYLLDDFVNSLMMPYYNKYWKLGQ